MKRRNAVPMLLLLCGALLAVPTSRAAAQPQRTHTVVLAGGCFWGMEGVFERLRGVTNVVSGYAGGSAATAHYEIVSTGQTGHAESVQITYDPSKISFNEILKVYFFVAHDPTELNRQGPDAGTQYRSEIFYTTAEQRVAATAFIVAMTGAKRFAAPIVTLVEPLRAFYPAEGYHQHFMDQNPDNPYIVYNDKPKVDHLIKMFPNLLKR